MTETEQKKLSLHGQLRIAAACPDTNAPLFAEAADAIEQHEAFRQEVSDAVELSIDRSGHDGLRAGHINEYLGRFIIPAPKPDPLVDVWKQQYPDDPLPEASCNNLYAALDALGFEIREKNDDQ